MRKDHSSRLSGGWQCHYGVWDVHQRKTAVKRQQQQQQKPKMKVQSKYKVCQRSQQ